MTKDREQIIKDIEKQINAFPPFSPVINKVISVIDNPTSSATDIENVIRYDQSLASRVLRMANSAYYGYSGKISTISQAIVILGLNTLRAVLFTATASKTINKKLSGYKLLDGEFWKHSVMTAIGSRQIAEKVRYKNVEEAFVCGLLHDLGKLLLDSYIINLQKEMDALINSTGLSLSEAELQLLGINHSQVGKRIAVKSNFPTNIVEVINFHHNPIKSSIQQLSAIVCAANYAGLKAIEGFEGRYPIPREEEIAEAMSILKFDKTFLEDLSQRILSALKDAETFLKV